MKKIAISGEGGQGIRFIAHALAVALIQLGYHVSLLYDYDSAIRTQKSLAYLTYDEKPIGSPMVEVADIMLMLSKKEDNVCARKIVCESGLCTDEQVPFSEFGAEKFGGAIFGNTIALGHLLRLIGVDIGKLDLEKTFPKKLFEENIKAVRFGYEFEHLESRE
ncbi:MAG: 2-oxoacid:acceptor oxidoreductase family protein [Candidatus Hydrothermarchaeota archaeon]